MIVDFSYPGAACLRALWPGNSANANRVQAGVALVEPDGSTLYSNDARGYTDYPTMAKL